MPYVKKQLLMKMHVTLWTYGNRSCSFQSINTVKLHQYYPPNTSTVHIDSKTLALTIKRCSA